MYSGSHWLAHAEGTKWKKHKYIRKEGDRYIYPEDITKDRYQRQKHNWYEDAAAGYTKDRLRDPAEGSRYARQWANASARNAINHQTNTAKNNARNSADASYRRSIAVRSSQDAANLADLREKSNVANAKKYSDPYDGKRDGVVRFAAVRKGSNGKTESKLVEVYGDSQYNQYIADGYTLTRTTEEGNIRRFKNAISNLAEESIQKTLGKKVSDAVKEAKVKGESVVSSLLSKASNAVTSAVNNLTPKAKAAKEKGKSLVDRLFNKKPQINASISPEGTENILRENILTENILKEKTLKEKRG